MKVDTMRRIDYLAGVPLAFLLTLVFRLAGLFRSRRQVRPQNVLFIELSEMGSAILVDPALRKMRAAGTELHFAIFSKNAASLRLLDTVPEANVFTIREDGLVPLAVDTLRFLLWCRKRRIDTVIDLELFSRYTALLTGLSGAPNRIGFHAFHNEGLYRGELLTRRVAYNPHMHIAKNFVALVNAALSESEQQPFSKTLIGDDEIRLEKARVSESDKEQVREKVRSLYPDYRPERHRLVLINPNASDLLPQRRWMPDHFVEVMRRILADHEDVLILITGAPAERGEAEGLKARVGSERCLNFAGQVKFTELPALYSIAATMLTNDSGPGHFSAVTDLPTFVIFGPETPHLYGSLGNSTPIYAGLACSPCVSAANHRKTPCRDNVCIQVITPEQVLGAMGAVLG
jgi:ADP-heptose:LPS heptosyltransferase